MMAPISKNIRDNMATLINSMTVAGGYNFDWGLSNELDDAMADTVAPRAIILKGPERCTDENGGAWSQVYTIDAEYIIQVRASMETEEYDPEIDIQEVYEECLDDLKMLFGINSSLNGAGGLPIMYIDSELVPTDSGDNFVPSFLNTTWRVRYTSGRTNPENVE